jgi:hypothetical protein
MADDRRRGAPDDVAGEILAVLDRLEGLVDLLPDVANKATCIDLVVRLRLEATKLLDAGRPAM